MGGIHALLLSSFLIATGQAEEAQPGAEALTGDWGGVRTHLVERGFTLEAALKADVVSNLSGGLRRGTRYVDNWDFKLTADAARLLGWPDTTAHLHVISNHGGKPNETHVGSFMGVDNIEVATNTTKVFQAWLERGFLDGKFFALAGLYPVDSEFYVTRSTGIFLHPTGGMAAEVAQTGSAGPSIFPTSSFGIRARWQPTEKLYLQAAVVDGVPGNPHNPHGTHVRFDRGDGTFAIFEAGVRPGPAETIGNYALGYWRYTPRFDALVERDASGNPSRRVNRGAYFFAEQTVYRETEDSAQGLALFLRYGTASGDVNPLDHSYSVGLSYRGLFPGRDEDECGILVTRGHAGGDFKRAAGVPVAANETAIEATYRANITPWLAFQPALQWIAHPGLDATLRNAWVALARFEIAF